LPPSLAWVIAQHALDPAVLHATIGASIWIEGYGEVVAQEPDRPLLPASNQKLLVAMGALATFPRDGVLTTTVRSTAGVVAGTVTGDLVLVGGGDPTLTNLGSHSLDALAAQVRNAGITAVQGALVVDESRHDRARAARGWLSWHVPAHVGPLSALMVDDNRHRGDPQYVAQPALGNGELFAAALRRHGVTVGGPVTAGIAPHGARTVASVSSRPIPELVGDMLLQSDNETAEMLTREAARVTQEVGTTTVGIEVLTRALRPTCVELRGVSGDGSGLSRANLRAAREWRRLLQAVRRETWWPQLVASLPVAGRSGTLERRFRGTAAEGNLHAKTGTIRGGRALSGYLTTAGGRDVVFSVLVNGDGAAGAQPVVDGLLAALAADRS
jgi:D-alanyl-D-alanine carboxypeptidase/D-alanyl-D-alanine-endopeptidase (penicillin-binding protein 4)